jgi:hypothetical protein
MAGYPRRPYYPTTEDISEEDESSDSTTDNNGIKILKWKTDWDKKSNDRRLKTYRVANPTSSDHDGKSSSEEDDKEDEQDDDSEEILSKPTIKFLLRHFSKQNYPKHYIRKYIILVVNSLNIEDFTSDDEEQDEDEEETKLGKCQTLLVDVLNAAKDDKYHLTKTHLLEIVNNMNC